MATKNSAFIISLKKLDYTERQLYKLYRDALNEIEAELKIYFDRFAVKGKLTGNEMAKYNRLINLEKSIMEQLKKLGAKVLNNITVLNKSVYEESFFRTEYEIQEKANLGINFGKLNPEAVLATIKNPIPGVTLKELIQGITNNQLQQIKFVIGQAITQGLTITETSMRLKEIYLGDVSKGKMFGGALARAVRTARTETLRAYSTANLDSIGRAEEKGINIIKVWDATLDSRTRPQHRAMDGREADSDEYFTFPDGVRTLAPRKSGVARHDINCRCDIFKEVEGLSQEARKRAARDLDTGKTFISKYKTFKEYAEDKNINYIDFDKLKKLGVKNENK